MIQRSFEHSYQKALDDGEWDNQMFQLAFEMNLNSLGVMYQTDELIPVMGANVTQNLSESEIFTGSTTVKRSCSTKVPMQVLRT